MKKLIAILTVCTFIYPALRELNLLSTKTSWVVEGEVVSVFLEDNVYSPDCEPYRRSLGTCPKNYSSTRVVFRDAADVFVEGEAIYSFNSARGKKIKVFGIGKGKNKKIAKFEYMV